MPPKNEMIQAATDLAVRFHKMAVGQDGATVVFACCWVIAGLVLKAEEQTGQPAAELTGFIASHLEDCIDSLRDQASVP
jgi:hypothetical protein